MFRKVSSHEYDVIIIGAGLGGLVSAAVIAKKGFKVLIVEKNSYPGGCCSSFAKDGYIFNIGPSLFWGLDNEGPLYNLLDYLGIRESIITHDIFRRIDPGLQVVLPDHRLDIYTERKSLFEEFRREFPKSFTTLKEFYNRVDYINSEIFEDYSNYPFNMKREGERKTGCINSFIPLLSRGIKRMCLPKSIQSFFTRHNWDRSIKDFFSVQTMFFGQVDSFAAPLPFFSGVLTIPLKGLYYPLAGNQGFANLLAEKVLDLGGEIKYNVNVQSLLFDRKKAKGIRYDEGVVSKTIHAKKIIADTSLFNLKDDLIHEELPKKRLVKKFRNIRGKWTIFSLFLGIDSKAVPEPMKENLLMHMDGYEAHGERRVLYVHTSPEWDKKRAPVGKRALTALSFFPVENWKGKEKDLKKKNTAKLIEDLKKIIPFIKGNFNIVDIMTPPKFEKLFSRPSGIVGNLNGGHKKNRFDFYGLSHSLPLKDLYLVGEEAYPGYGTTNVMFSGFHAAERILEGFK